MNKPFNESFNRQGEKARFIYKPNPLLERSWQIFEFFEEKQNYEPVGDYTVLDKNQDIDIAEKHLGNMLALLNGHEDLTDLTKLTNKELFYNIISEGSETEPLKMMFRSHNGTGVSIENSVLTIRKGVFDEST